MLTVTDYILNVVLKILTVSRSAHFCNVSVLMLTTTFAIHISNFSGIMPSAPITTGVTFSFFHSISLSFPAPYL